MGEIKLTVLGGGHEVGKSRLLVSGGGKTIVLDSGLKLTEPPSYPPPPERADALILSHAHLDHTGSSAILHKKANVPVYATELTFELTRLLLLDSIKVGRLRGYTAKFSEHDLDRMQSSQIPINYDVNRWLGGKTSFKLIDAGHIPGSAGVLLNVDGTEIFYTGDTNPSDTMLLKGGRYPEADVLVTESTYGGEYHDDRKKTVKEFLAAVEETLDGGGVALIPAFGVGRTQEVLMMLENMSYPVYLDGMGKTVIRILLEFPEYLRDPDLLQKTAMNAEWVRHEGERKRICRESSIIVTTAGMLTGGPVMSYLKRLHKNSKNGLFLTGYQVEGTNGRKLLDGGMVVDERGNRKMRVRNRVHQFDFSGHADHKQILEIAKKVNPKKVVLVHGEDDGIDALKPDLTKNYKVYAPKNGERVNLA